MVNISVIMRIPVLFISFNRPDHVKRVLRVIMAAQPQNLYVFQDGARDNNTDDVKKCAEVRRVIEELVLGEETNLHTYYSEHNLGCGPGPATAINWFFEKEEMGIVIEDDAIPHPDFFPYCEELLMKYKTDDEVMAIGSMHFGENVYGDGSYYFSMMNRTLCAWATWRRAWQDFDLYHRSVTRSKLNWVLKQYGCGLRMREYWCERLTEVQQDAYHNSSWDQQFWISIWLHHGKGIMPNVNLCTNIGFGAEATHTFNGHCVVANIPNSPIMPLKHPADTRISRVADWRFQKEYFQPWEYGWSGVKRLPFRLNKRLKRLLGHQGSWLKKQ